MEGKEAESISRLFMQLVDSSQPLYFSKHVKEKGSEESAKNAVWKGDDSLPRRRS